MKLRTHRTPEVNHFEERFKALGIENLPAISGDDLMLLGSYIQLFCYIETNLRRSVEVFVKAKKASLDNYLSLNGADLIPNLIKVLESLGIADVETTENLKLIEDRRKLRHMLAHWTVRKIPNENGIVMFTNDWREIRRIEETPYIPFHFVSAITSMETIRESGECIAELDKWLAEKTAEWHMRYIGL